MHEIDPSIENRRDFVNFISDLMKRVNIHGEMIFDTPIHHETVYPHKAENPPLVVSYAPTTLEADDLIVEKLYALENKAFYTVVTSDRGLSYRVKEQDVKVIKVDTFLTKLHRTKRKATKVKKTITYSNKELDRLEEIFIKKLEDASE